MGWEIDERHIEFLHQLAIASPKGSVICEIGSLRGSSTSAFVEALSLRPDLFLHIYETYTTPELVRLLENTEEAVKRRIFFYHRASYDMNHGPLSAKNYEGPRPNLVFIDGDHKWPAVADLGLCLTRGCGVICLHDTQRYSPRSWKICFGSILAAEILRKAPDRTYWEDKEKRVGENTHRGFLVSYPEKETWPCLVSPSE